QVNHNNRIQYIHNILYQLNHTIQMEKIIMQLNIGGTFYKGTRPFESGKGFTSTEPRGFLTKLQIYFLSLHEHKKLNGSLPDKVQNDFVKQGKAYSPSNNLQLVVLIIHEFLKQGNHIRSMYMFAAGNSRMGAYPYKANRDILPDKVQNDFVKQGKAYSPSIYKPHKGYQYQLEITLRPAAAGVRFDVLGNHIRSMYMFAAGNSRMGPSIYKPHKGYQYQLEITLRPAAAGVRFDVLGNHIRSMYMFTPIPHILLYRTCQNCLRYSSKTT
ncbi:hypothetical protein ACJX0J_023273, partial [Zea mays]